jgi:hypothetical protein
MGYERSERDTLLLAFSLLNGRFGLEVAEIFKVQTLIFTIQLHRPLFATLEDGFDVVVNHEPVK